MLSPGTMLGGRYRLDERIAGGGMGDVWRGTDEVLGRTVAVKILLPALLEEPGFAERFRGEARTMATVNHPGVVDVYDYGSEDGTAFLIMEYVEGDALSRTLTRVGRLTPARTMALVAQAADALHAAHDKGIVHRDVKPGNLLVRPNGTLVLTDFGIARSAMVGQLTAAGSVLGTASYISPEQASGQGATALSDVYALGVVAYQCLFGKRPFEGDNPLEIAMRHVREAPAPLPGDIPPAVRQVVERAMAKDPAARWPSAAALAQVARRVAAQLSPGGATGTGMPAGVPIPPLPGAPGSPAPAMPGSPVVSGPPVSPSSPVMPAPTSPVAAGGTRVMPGAALGAQAASAQPTHAARGAAGVPPPPPPTDTVYSMTAGYGAPPPVSPTRTGSRGLVVVAVVLAVLLVLGGGGLGVWYLTRTSSNPPGGGGSGQTSAPATTGDTDPTASAGTKLISCEGIKTRQVSFARRELEDAGYKVTVQQVNGPRNRIVEVTPCGRVPVGSEVTIKVGNGNPVTGPSADTTVSPGSSAAAPGLASCQPGQSPLPGTNLCLPGGRS
jgi:serine/threonine-protein kinase